MFFLFNMQKHFNIYIYIYYILSTNFVLDIYSFWNFFGTFSSTFQFQPRGIMSIPLLVQFKWRFDYKHFTKLVKQLYFNYDNSVIFIFLVFDSIPLNKRLSHI